MLREKVETLELKLSKHPAWIRDYVKELLIENNRLAQRLQVYERGEKTKTSFLLIFFRVVDILFYLRVEDLL